MVSIFGLAYVQYQYLKIGLNLAKVQFNEKIEKAIVDIKSGLRTENELTFLVASALLRDTTFFKSNPESVLDASSYFLNDYLRENLTKNGVEADFAYTLMTRDSVYYLNSPEGFTSTEKNSEFPILLEGYLPNTFENRFVLNLKFNSLNRYFLSQLNGLVLPSLLFIVAIIVAIIWGLRTYYWQRRVITTTDAFINNLTHELKTPVFSINLASKMLADKVDDSGTTFLAIIKQQSQRLSDHIENVLELATIERKRSAIQLKPINFEPYLRKVCEEFKVLVSLEEVVFTYQIQGDAFNIIGEPFHLENVVNNLLDNAKKYSESPRIQLKAYKDQKFFYLDIEDNGRGISQKEQQKVFDKYYRATEKDLHAVKGFGLGLNYVKTVIKRHKGKILLKSTLGQGTIVSIQIPLNE